MPPGGAACQGHQENAPTPDARTESQGVPVAGIALPIPSTIGVRAVANADGSTRSGREKSKPATRRAGFATQGVQAEQMKRTTS